MRRECSEGLGRPNEGVGRRAAGAEAVDAEPVRGGGGAELLEGLVAEEGRGGVWRLLHLVRVRLRVRVRVRLRLRVRVRVRARWW